MKKAKSLLSGPRVRALDEYDLLIYYLEECEDKGVNASQIAFSVDQKAIDDLNNRFSTEVDFQSVCQLVDKCCALDYLKHGTLDANYKTILLTLKGKGAAVSKRSLYKKEKSISCSKRFSNYIEDHKGLFLLGGFIITLLTFIFALIGGSNV